MAAQNLSFVQWLEIKLNRERQLNTIYVTLNKAPSSIISIAVTDHNPNIPPPSHCSIHLNQIQSHLRQRQYVSFETSGIFILGCVMSFYVKICISTAVNYRGADKSLARPISDVFCLMVRIFLLMLVLFYIYKYY